MQVRGVEVVLLRALLAAHQQRIIDEVGTTKFHYHQSCTDNQTDPFNVSVTRLTVATANATDSTTSVALVNVLKSTFNTHIVDGPDSNGNIKGAHKANDTTNPVATANATDTTSGITLANAIKANYNTHLSQTGVHPNNDATNSVATANATDQTTLTALVNSIKSSFNAHMASGANGFYITAPQSG